MWVDGMDCTGGRRLRCCAVVELPRVWFSIGCTSRIRVRFCYGTAVLRGLMVRTVSTCGCDRQTWFCQFMCGLVGNCSLVSGCFAGTGCAILRSPFVFLQVIIYSARFWKQKNWILWLWGEENASVPELEDWGAWLGLHELDLDEQAVLLLGSGPTLDVIGQ